MPDGQSPTAPDATGAEPADSAARASLPDGDLGDRIDLIRPLLLSFGSALGGDPETVLDLPFIGRDRTPESLYVRHAESLLDRVTEWLGEGCHGFVYSEPGTGKTALRSVVERDVARHDGYVLASLPTLRSVSERGVYERVIRAVGEAGYAVDPDNYWRVDDGIPWQTDEVAAAVADVVEQTSADGTQVVLVVDELEAGDERLAATLGDVADAGAVLFMLGRPEAREVATEIPLLIPSEAYESIPRFDVRDVAEYAAREMAAFRGESFDGSPSGLFSGDAIEYLVDATRGHPREVRRICLDLFTRAALVWDDVDTDIERVTITSALADRDFQLADAVAPD